MFKVILFALILGNSVGFGQCILNGIVVNPKNARPFVAMIGFNTTFTDGTYHGAILDEFTVITICSPMLSQAVKVIGGKFRVNKADDNQQVREICHYSVDPASDGQKHCYALLHLAEPFTFSKSVKSIQLAPEGAPIPILCTKIGWGRTQVNEQGAFATELREKSTQSTNVFTEVDEKQPTYVTTSGMCSGDWGSPIACIPKKDAEYLLYGLTQSFDSACDLNYISYIPEIPQDWLKQELRDAPDKCKCEEGCFFLE